MSNEDLNFIVNNYHKIEIYSENQYNFSKFNQNEIKRFLKILPIIYFTLEIKNEEKVNIFFYLKLAKIYFLEVINSKVILLIKQTNLPIPETRRSLSNYYS